MQVTCYVIPHDQEHIFPLPFRVALQTNVPYCDALSTEAAKQKSPSTTDAITPWRPGWEDHDHHAASLGFW